MSRIAKDLADGAHRSQPVSIDGMQRLRQTSSKMPNTAIIGAGVSGLRCADLLLKSGAKVTIFEARNRVGGRLYQRESGGFLMDMGANWIHGTNKNPIAKLAEKTKTTILEPDEDNLIFGADGNQRTVQESKDLSARMRGLTLESFTHSD